MVTTNLTRDQIAAATGSAVGLTAAGLLLGALDPALAGHTAPHPVLTGSVGDALGILQNNARVLGVPFLLSVFRFPVSRAGRYTGDLLVFGVTAANTIAVGIELGRWRDRLIPYLPQLPLEWAALIVAVCAWLVARGDDTRPQELAMLASITALLLIGGASLETWCTPHKHPDPNESRPATYGTSGHLASLGAGGGCLRRGFCAGKDLTASRSPAPFPSPSSVPLGHLTGADRATSTNTDPTRRGQMLNITGNGNIIRAPELRTTPTGKAVTTISVACQQRNRDEEPTYVDLVIWETQAEAAVKYLVKGQAVSFTGRPDVRGYKRNNGEPGATLQVNSVDLEYGAMPHGRQTESTPNPEAAEVAA
jgi:single-strand DNA-binding protein